MSGGLEELFLRSLRSKNLSLTHPTKKGNSFVQQGRFLDHAYDLDKILSVNLPCQVLGSWLTRYPIQGITEPTPGVSLRGITGSFQFDAKEINLDQAKKCVAKLAISE